MSCIDHMLLLTGSSLFSYKYVNPSSNCGITVNSVDNNLIGWPLRLLLNKIETEHIFRRLFHVVIDDSDDLLSRRHKFFKIVQTCRLICLF